jgi:hypothetical protein
MLRENKPIRPQYAAIGNRGGEFDFEIRSGLERGDRIVRENELRKRSGPPKSEPCWPIAAGRFGRTS